MNFAICQKLLIISVIRRLTGVDSFLLVKNHNPKNGGIQIISVSLTSTSESSITSTTEENIGIGSNISSQPSIGLYEIQEELITKRGKYEEILMDGKSSVLEAFQPKVKGVNSGGGFGGSGGGSKKKKGGGKKPNKAVLKAEGKEFARILRNDGVVRLDNILSADTADDVRKFCFDLRRAATEQVESGAINPKYRFADVLLRKNRCDLTMPLGHDIIYKALYEILVKSPVGATLANILGKDAPLYEFSCLISDPGSSRQVIHPDTPCRSGKPDDPVLITSFVALQDVTLEMGPTCWLPGTHNIDVHEVFKQEEDSSSVENQHQCSTAEDLNPSSLSPKDKLLYSRDYVLGVLPKGACGMFDSRLLHCGTANKSDENTKNKGTSRAIFYTSFQMSKSGYPGNPGSIRPELVGQLTLSQLQKELQTYMDKSEETPSLKKLANSLR